jgi:hypothetical protein
MEVHSALQLVDFPDWFVAATLGMHNGLVPSHGVPARWSSDYTRPCDWLHHKHPLLYQYKLQSVPMARFAHFVRVPTFATRLQLVVGCAPKPLPSHLSISKVEHCVLASGV